MGTCWGVLTIGEGINYINIFSISILILISVPSFSVQTKLIVWDTQTGVVIGEMDIPFCHRIMFHGDQRTITLSTTYLGFYTYDAVTSTQLCQGKIQSTTRCMLSTFWVYKDTLRFAISSENYGKYMIDIYELQPTSNSPLHAVSSFPVPFHMEFSFSPVSFHASFVTGTEFIILDVQNSQLLLQTTPASINCHLPPLFSADGNFAAYTALMDEICVWKNISTCYVPWCSLRPQLGFGTFFWSPTSLSILCQSTSNIQLLSLDNHPSIPPPYKIVPCEKHLVAYSTDGTHVAIAKQGHGHITLFNHILCTPEELVDVWMEAEDIKISGNTIFAVDWQKLVSWNLNGDYDNKRETKVHLATPESDLEYLRLSHDCSQIAYTSEDTVYIYNVQAQKTLQCFHCNLLDSMDFQFSPNEDQLWIMDPHGLTGTRNLSLRKLEIEDGWNGCSLSEGDHLGNEWSWINLFSSYGYCVEVNSEWVTDSRGNKCLWLPLAWRIQYWKLVRWDGKFLALLSGHYPRPIIVEFQSQSILHDPPGT